jgi:hypothetical protein
VSGKLLLIMGHGRLSRAVVASVTVHINQFLCNTTSCQFNFHIISYIISFNVVVVLFLFFKLL